MNKRIMKKHFTRWRCPHAFVQKGLRGKHLKATRKFFRYLNQTPNDFMNRRWVGGSGRNTKFDKLKAKHNPDTCVTCFLHELEELSSKTLKE